MKKTFGGLIKDFFVSSPLSLFDVLVSAFLLMMAFWPNQYEKLLIFNFGVILLLMVSILLKTKREYKSYLLVLLGIWSFAQVFIHSYKQDILMFRYMNIALLGEGFIYIFSSIILLHLIVRYCSKYLIFLYPILLLPYIAYCKGGGRMTFIAAVIIATGIYFIIKKYYIRLLILTPLVLILFVRNIEWIKMKWAVRPFIWRDLWYRVMQHPIIGCGFNKSLENKSYIDIAIDPGKPNSTMYGTLYRHNDYLTLGYLAGVISMVLAGAFILKTTYDLRKTPAFIITCSVMLACFFQNFMQDIYRASMFVSLIGLAITYDKRSV